MDSSLPDAPFQRHSSTSIAAAASIKPSANTLRTQVLEYLRQRAEAGATDEEMQQALDMNPSTQRPRRLELMEDFELVFSSGKKRATQSGRDATIWVVREFAPTDEVDAQLVLNAAKRAKEAEEAEAKRQEKAAKQAEKDAQKAVAATLKAAVAAVKAETVAPPTPPVSAPGLPAPAAKTTVPVAPISPMQKQFTFDPFDLNPRTATYPGSASKAATQPSPPRPVRAPAKDPFTL